MLRPLVFLICHWYGQGFQAVARSPSEPTVRSELLPGGSLRLLPPRDRDEDVDAHAKASGSFAQASSSHGLAGLLDIQDSLKTSKHVEPELGLGKQWLEIESRASAAPNSLAIVPRQVAPHLTLNISSGSALVERRRAMEKIVSFLGVDAFVITNVLDSPEALDMHKKFAVLGTGAFMFFLAGLSQTGLQQRCPLAVPVLIWGCSSIMMNVMNKLAVTILPLPLTLVSIQMLIAAIVVFMAMGNVAILREMSEKRKSTMIWAALTLPFTGLLVTSMLAVENGTVTTLLIVRNALPLVALFVERLVLPQNCTPITLQACLSLGTIASGTLVYTFFDLRQTKGWFAVLCICANMVITVGYRVLERRTLIDSAMTLSLPAMVLINNTVGLVPISLAVFCRHEYLQWGQLPLIFEAHLWKEPVSAACILLSGCTGLSLSFFSITVQRQVSATHMLTLQSSFKILIILLAMLLLNDRLSLMTGFGCAVSLIGSMWYAYASQKPAQKEPVRQEPLPKKSDT